MTASHIIAAIMAGEFGQDDLRAISDALRAAYKIDGERRLIQARTTLREGQHVILFGLRPKRLNGVLGTVTNFRASAARADLTVTGPTWASRKNNGDVIHGIPLVCMKPDPARAKWPVNATAKRKALDRVVRGSRSRKGGGR